MRKYLTISVVGLLFTVVAMAQNDVPKYETYLGFQFLRANQFNQNVGLGQTIGGFSMYGGDGQFVYNGIARLSVESNGPRLTHFTMPSFV